MRFAFMLWLQEEQFQEQQATLKARVEELESKVAA